MIKRFHRRRPKPRRIFNIGGEFNRTGRRFLHGPPALWVEQLTELTLVHGVSGYILYRVESGDVIRRFATRWSRRLRSAVSSERGRRGIDRTSRDEVRCTVNRPLLGR